MAATNRDKLSQDSETASRLTFPTPGRALVNANPRINVKGGTDLGWFHDSRNDLHFDRDERSLVNFCKALYIRDVECLRKVYGSERNTESSAQVTKTAMNEASGQAGGYTVPPDYTDDLMSTFAESCFIYPRALVIPMGGKTCDAPRIDVETVPAAGVSPFFGQMAFTWGSEQAATESEPQFRKNQLNAWDLLGYTLMSNQFLWDIQSSPLSKKAESYLYRLFGKAGAWAAEYAFLQGLGTGNQMPQGMLNSACALSQSRAGGNAIAVSDIANMAAKLLPFSWSTAIWLCSPTALAQIAQLSSFTINRPIYDEEGSKNPSVGALLTLPLYVTEKLPKLGTPGDLMLIDPSLYVIGDRHNVLIDVSPHTAFRTNQTAFRIWYRLDGMPIMSKYATLQDTTTQVSSVVYLK